MGLHPDWDWDYYTGMVSGIKKNFPQIDVKAFTAVEIDFFAKKFKKTHEEVLLELKAAGLATMPGGGAEVFSERVRKLLFNQKIGAKTWFAVHKLAHRLGIQSNATLLYGHIETLEERIEHMMKLREAQDETGGFLSFIPLAFQPGDTGIKTRNAFTSAVDDLKTIAVSRLMLDNFPHIKAYWVMLTPEVATVALNFGADDMDGTVGEERIAHDAGAISPMEMAKGKLIEIIHEAGKVPVERDVWYNHIKHYPREGTHLISKMPYLNSTPFYEKLDLARNDLALVPLVPSALGRFSRVGEIVAGPMSLLDYKKVENDFELIDYCVAVRGKAHSVLLYSKYSWSELRGKRIGITHETSTSVELLRVLLEKQHDVRDYEFVSMNGLFAANDLSHYDAVLLIGDEALRQKKTLPLSKFNFVYDLGEEWYNWKQMPFVFAVWAVSRTLDVSIKTHLTQKLLEAINAAEENLGRAGEASGIHLGMSHDDVERYLAAFTYKLGLRELVGMKEFLKLLSETKQHSASGEVMKGIEVAD